MLFPAQLHIKTNGVPFFLRSGYGMSSLSTLRLIKELTFEVREQQMLLHNLYTCYCKMLTKISFKNKVHNVEQSEKKKKICKKLYNYQIHPILL